MVFAHEINLAALTSYVLIMAYTPGPGNISSASMGLLYGYKKTVNYLLGLTTGVFIMMLLTGLISDTLLNYFPSFEKSFRAVGAAYIIWLAFITLKATYKFDAKVF